MELKQAIWGRRSIRKFKRKKIERKTIDKILEAGVQAPSSCNQQMYYFILIENNFIKKALEERAKFKWLDRIPNPIFVICDKRYGNERFANLQGASASIQNMILFAYSINIGSCWIAGYGDKAIVKEILNIPSYFHILGCIGFGYPDEKPLKPLKRDIKEISFVDRTNFPKDGSNNPDKWEFKEINNLAERAIFAKSPDIGYYSLFDSQFKNEIRFLSNKIGEKNLVVYDVSGIYSIELAKKNNAKRFTILITGEKIKLWLEERIKLLQLKNITCEKGLIETHKGEYDCILHLEILNRIPKKNHEIIIKESKRLIRKEGKIISSFLNKKSVYGVLFKKGIGRRYGPEISRTEKEIKEIYQKMDLKIKEEIGFNILPSFRLFFKTGIPGRYTFLNRYLRYLSKYNLLEKTISKNWPLKSISTNIFLIIKK